MECKFCNMPAQGKTCQYCGAPLPESELTQESAMPEVTTLGRITITNVVNTPNSSVIRCPKCKNSNTEVISFKAKKVSVGKVAAGVMTGGLSLLATGINNKNKTEYYCHGCGNRWKI